jgi:hypothetical protein
MLRAFRFTVLLFLSPFLTFGQNIPVCGTTHTDQQQLLEQLEENKNRAARFGISERNSVRYVPVHFHRVGDNAGEGRISINKILDQMCSLNRQYDTLEVQFYLSPHPTAGYGLFNASISHDNVYSIQTNGTLMNQRRHPRAVNVFAVDEPVSGNTPQPGTITQAYYSTNPDWIVMRKSEFTNSLSNGVLAHELGHFFSLPHTFLGYESNPFGPTDPGWPRAPVISPGGNATERMNGTNCNTAGDRICDTPPDYGFSQSNCNPYAGGARDPLGTLVNPSEQNFMGYFESCQYEFTPTQRNIIRSDLDATRRNYLDNTFAPAAIQFITPSNFLKAPASGAVTDFYDEVLVQWNRIPEATYYLLELDVTQLYSTPQAQTWVLNGNITSQLFTNLQPGRTYYWRVRPFNEVYTCALARQRSFKTPQTSAAPEATDLNAVLLAPNPTPAGQAALLHLHSKTQTMATVTVTDVLGRVLWTTAHPLRADNSEALPLPILPAAHSCYLVHIRTASQQLTKKWIVGL